MQGEATHEDEALSIRRGQRYVRGLALQVVLVSALSIVDYNLSVGSEKLAAQLFRFMLTLWLSHSLAAGRPLARILAVVLLGLGGVAGAVLCVVAPTHFISTVAAGTYLFGAWILTMHPDVKAFFAHHDDREATG